MGVAHGAGCLHDIHHRLVGALGIGINDNGGFLAAICRRLQSGCNAGNTDIGSAFAINHVLAAGVDAHLYG